MEDHAGTRSRHRHTTGATTTGLEELGFVDVVVSTAKAV